MNEEETEDERAARLSRVLSALILADMDGRNPIEVLNEMQLDGRDVAGVLAGLVRLLTRAIRREGAERGEDPREAVVRRALQLAEGR